MLKLGIYSFEKTPQGFTIYTTVSNFFHEDGSPWLERIYSLDFRRWDDGKLYWSLYKFYPQMHHIDGDKTPKTIAHFAAAVCNGSTIFDF